MNRDHFNRLKSQLEARRDDTDRLLGALELLNDIYCEIGPYRDGKIADKTWSAVRDFFQFDDSE